MDDIEALRYYHELRERVRPFKYVAHRVADSYETVDRSEGQPVDQLLYKIFHSARGVPDRNFMSVKNDAYQSNSRNYNHVKVECFHPKDAAAMPPRVDLCPYGNGKTCPNRL